MKIEQIELREVQMPLISFFETSFGRTTLRRVILVRVFGEGLVGYGESTAPEGPFYNHESTATAWHVLQDFVVPRVFASEITHPRDVAPLLKPIRGHNMAKAAVETAIWDLYARLQGKPLHELLGGRRKTLDCGVSIGIQENPGILLDKIERELLAGYRRIKIKIKPGWDVAVVREVRRRFPEILLMCDANSAYSLADLEHLKALDDFDLLMIEQPLAWNDILDHVQLQKALRTPICLDESILDGEDARKAIEAGALPDHQHQIGESRRLQRSPPGSRRLPGSEGPRLVRGNAGIGHRPSPQRRPLHPGEFQAAGRCFRQQALFS